MGARWGRDACLCSEGLSHPSMLAVLPLDGGRTCAFTIFVRTPWFARGVWTRGVLTCRSTEMRRPISEMYSIRLVSNYLCVSSSMRSALASCPSLPRSTGLHGFRVMHAPFALSFLCIAHFSLLESDMRARAANAYHASFACGANWLRQIQLHWADCLEGWI